MFCLNKVSQSEYLSAKCVHASLCLSVFDSLVLLAIQLKKKNTIVLLVLLIGTFLFMLVSETEGSWLVSQ